MSGELDFCEWDEEEAPFIGYMSGLYQTGEDPELEHLIEADFVTWNASPADVAEHLIPWLAGKNDRKFHVFVKEAF